VKRFLNGNFASEVKNGSLNGSSRETEKYKGANNKTFVKKITIGLDKYPYASTSNVKYNIKAFVKEQGHTLSNIYRISKEETLSEGHPYKNYDEDIFGYMNAKNHSISKDDYNKLSEIEQKGYKLSKGKYVKNITKKRKGRLQMSPLQSIGPARIVDEFNIRNTNDENNIFIKEVYGTIMSSGFNLNISDVGKFIISADTSGFRDYTKEEAELYNLNIEDSYVHLPKNEKFNRIKDTLKGIQFLSSTVRHTNNLEDITPKFIIMGEYSIGSNLFNNIFRNNRLDIDYLSEAIIEHESFRISKIYIGIRSGFMPNIKKNVEDMIDFVEQKLDNKDIFVVASMGDTFDGYINYLDETLNKE
jgi:CRISPR-associated autoregulator DevR family